jgi:hypothetical protein
MFLETSAKTAFNVEEVTLFKPGLYDVCPEYSYQCREEQNQFRRKCIHLLILERA